MEFNWQYALGAVVLYLAAFALSLLGVAATLVYLPADYFVEGPTRADSSVQHPLLRVLWRLAKNLLGLCLVVVGLLLSMPGIPGQGLLTVLIGLMLLDFPGKRRVERAILSRPRVLAAANRLRGRFGKPPLRLSERENDGVVA